MPKRAIEINDLYEFKIPACVAISPDGRSVAWAEKRVDVEAKKAFSNLWLSRSGDARRFTFGAHNDTAPQFSPDGKSIAFVRSAPGDNDATTPTQICVIATDGGEARVVLEAKGAFSGPQWSPDGRWLLVSFRKNDELPEGRTSPVSIRVTKFRYKSDEEGYLPKDRFSLYTIDTTADVPELIPLTDADGDWDDTQPTWSPDGKSVAFISQRRAERDRDQDNADLYVVPAEGGDPVQCTRERGFASSPTWAPDGSWIALLACPGPILSSLFRKNIELFRCDPTGAQPERSLTADIDRCIMNLTIDDMWGLDHWMQPPMFSADGNRVLFPVSDEGTTYLGAFDLDEAGDVRGDLQRVIDDRVVVCFDSARDSNMLALITSSPTEPGRIERCDPSGGECHQVGWPMAAYCDSVNIVEPIELRAPTSDGAEVHGWILLPEGDGPHPLLLDIHGGPVVQFGTSFFHELQLWCSKGYAVLFVNPRGSQGYGVDHVEVIHRDWASKPYIDLMAAVDYAVEHYPIDTERMGVLGGSYGGYMTNWVIAHTHRFKAACTQRTVSCMESMIFSDFGYMWGDELEAWYWEDKEIYERMSPITYAQNIQTPLLIMQGLADNRTPADQGERLYTTLRVMGKDAEMVLFPGANHDLSRNGPPEQRAERLRVIHEWFAVHLQPG